MTKKEKNNEYLIRKNFHEIRTFYDGSLFGRKSDAKCYNREKALNKLPKLIEKFPGALIEVVHD